MKDWGAPYLDGASEPQYEYIRPKILVEELLDPIPDDIKVWVYNHQVNRIRHL